MSGVSSELVSLVSPVPHQCYHALQYKDTMQCICIQMQ